MDENPTIWIEVDDIVDETKIAFHAISLFHYISSFVSAADMLCSFSALFVGDPVVEP